MRIIQIMQYPGQGGAEQYAYLLAKYALSDGNQVDFIFGEEGPLVSRVEELGCGVHYIKMRAPYDPKAVLDLVNLFKKIKPDVVHTHFLRENFLAIEASKFIHIPAIFSTVHRLEPKTPVQAFANKTFSRSLTKFIAVSQLAKEYLINEGVKESKIVTILNGAEVANGRSGSILKKLGIPSGGKIISYVGRITSEKGHKTLIKAFSRLKDSESVLVLVGDGDLRDQAEKQARRLAIENRVFFTGNRNNGYEIIAASDLYVQPSEIENLPMSVVEAMLLGIPIVASDCKAHKLLLKDGKLGRLFKNKNADSLSGTLEEALGNTRDSKKFASEAKKYAELHLTGEKMWNSTKHLYEKYAQNHHIVIE